MTTSHRFDHEPYRIAPGKAVNLAKHDTAAPKEFNKKKKVMPFLAEDVDSLVEAQRLLWANKHYSLLIILQGLDASGKDSAIRHVMSGVNPQGCDVHGFRAPSEEERQHHFLWRPMRFLPGRGRIAIFNRSYYEEVLIVRIHPKFLEAQNVQADKVDGKFWKGRFKEIETFESMMRRNGTVVIKFFLHHSKEEQLARFTERLENPEKHWKFELQDVRERAHWNDYMKAYEDMLPATSTKAAPWYVIPSDSKWFARALIADIIVSHIRDLHDDYPSINDEQREELEEGKRLLAKE